MTSRPPTDPSWVEPASAKRRSVTIAAVVVLVIVAIGFAAGRWLDRDHPARTNAHAANLDFPASVAGYTRDTSPQVQAILKGLVASFKSDLQTAKTAAYQRVGGTTATIVVVGASAHDDPALNAALSGDNLETTVSDFFIANSVAGARSYPTGPLDGVMHCGSHAGADAAAICVWAGHSTFGFVIGLSSEVTPEKLAVVSQTIRVAAEH